MARDAGAPESFPCRIDSVDSRAGDWYGKWSLPLPATCVLPVAKKPSCRSLKLAPVWSLAVAYGATVAPHGRGRALK